MKVGRIQVDLASAELSCDDSTPAGELCRLESTGEKDNSCRAQSRPGKDFGAPESIDSRTAAIIDKK